jgi:glycosyltransferase involved in cell wall biosynthesis
MSEPRHIVFLTTDFRPMVGGVADHLHRMADHLAARTPVTVMTTVPFAGASWPHAYRLVALDPLPDRRLGLQPGDSLPPLRKLRTGAHFLALRRYADRLLAGIKEQQGDDVAVVIGIWDTASHFWCDACRRARVPYYIVAYGVELLLELYGRLPRWRSIDFSRSVRVIAVSRATATLAADSFALATPPAVVNPSVGPRPAAADIASRAADLRRELGLQRESEGPILLTVGRLVPRKGCDLVLRSVAELAAEYPGLRYIVAGNGPERARLDGLARELGITDRLRMLGDVDDLTKWAAYDICDVFVSPTRPSHNADWEGFGIVFLEAALSRRPAIGGRTGGTADAIVDGLTGVLVDPDAPGELSGAIRRLLSDAGLRARLGRTAEQMARTRFTGEAALRSLREQLTWN